MKRKRYSIEKGYLLNIHPSWGPLGINRNGLGASKTVELWIKNVLMNMKTRKSNPEK